MAQRKYYFNPITCRYEPIQKSLQQRLLNWLGLGIVNIGLAGLFFIFISAHIDSPGDARARYKNKLLKQEYHLFQQEIKQVKQTLKQLQETDRYYRSVTGMRLLSDAEFQAGTGGTKQYQDLEQESPVIISTLAQIDHLTSQILVHRRSGKDITKKVERRNIYNKAKPLLIPISPGHVKRFGDRFSPKRFHPTRRKYRAHRGQDIAALKGTPIYSPGQGKILQSRYSATAGNLILIEHPFGFRSQFFHLNERVLHKGDQVKRGQLIGYVGATGSDCDGAHLHYEIQEKSKNSRYVYQPVNPMGYMQELPAHEYNELIKQANGGKIPVPMPRRSRKR